MNLILNSRRSPTGAEARRTSRIPIMRIALALLSVLGLSAAWSNPHFHAPYSGERVESYEVTLPASALTKQTFQIPRDCQRAHSVFGFGASQWGSRVERRVWDKVMQDCYYYAFLQHAGPQAAHDFVSNFDFRNADLRELAAATGCDGAPETPCESLPPGFVLLRQVLARMPEESEHGGSPSAEQCRLEKGVFRGWVSFEPDGMICLRDRHANGFRIVAIDYADANADGFLDAIIRLMPIGRGVRHTPLILPLTRTRPDGLFRVPKHLVRF